MTDRQLLLIDFLLRAPEPVRFRLTQAGDPKKQAEWQRSIFQRHMAHRRLGLHGEVPQDYHSQKETPLDRARRLWRARGKHAHDRRIARKP